MEKEEEIVKCVSCNKGMSKKCNFFRENGDFGFGKDIDLKISLKKR
ncbi:MAG: hypothetical protein WC942_08750 [Clostridia bacterium]|jgi:hypothetical protein